MGTILEVWWGICGLSIIGYFAWAIFRPARLKPSEPLKPIEPDMVDQIFGAIGDALGNLDDDD